MLPKNVWILLSDNDVCADRGFISGALIFYRCGNNCFLCPQTVRLHFLSSEKMENDTLNRTCLVRFSTRLEQ